MKLFALLLLASCGAICTERSTLVSGPMAPVPSSMKDRENEVFTLSADRTQLVDAYDQGGQHYELTYLAGPVQKSSR